MNKIPAVFMRGGTSKGVFFHARDLPAERASRDAILLEVLGSPDRYQRQLNGMGGGVSSLSKAAIIAPSRRSAADVEYTFAQVAVDEPIVDYASNCGNLAAAVGPFAIEEGLAPARNGEVLVRIFNTNTAKFIHARFEVKDGVPVEKGDLEIAGVAGTGAPIILDFLAPGGSVASGVMPTGAVLDVIDDDEFGPLQGSLFDATNPMVFVRASDLGLTGFESPDVLERQDGLLQGLERIRRQAAVRMGLAASSDEAPYGAPKIGMLASPGPFKALDGRLVDAATYDIAVRMVSMGRIHRAVTLTGALCLAAGCKIEGSLPNQLCRSVAQPIRVGHPSGTINVDADVRGAGSSVEVRSASVCRTARRLMEGAVRLAR